MSVSARLARARPGDPPSSLAAQSPQSFLPFLLVFFFVCLCFFLKKGCFRLYPKLMEAVKPQSWTRPPSPVCAQGGLPDRALRERKRITSPPQNSRHPRGHPSSPAACAAGQGGKPLAGYPGDGHVPRDSGTCSQRGDSSKQPGWPEQEGPSLPPHTPLQSQGGDGGCSLLCVCGAASGNFSRVCVGRCPQGRKVIGAEPGAWAIQMPWAQSLTSLSLNFISHETLAGSNRGESTRAICVLAWPGVSRVNGSTGAGQGVALGKDFSASDEALLPRRHGISETRESGRVTRPQRPVCPSSSPPETNSHAGTSLKQGCLEASLPGTGRPRDPGCQLGASSCNLPAATGLPHFLVCGAKSEGRHVTLGDTDETGVRAETPALSASRTRTGRRDEAALKPCNTYLLFFFPPQWNRWPGGKRSD